MRLVFATNLSFRSKPTTIMAEPSEELLRTEFFSLQQQAGARMVPFAGYEMPVQFLGIKAEHLHTRTEASLFDVSHMGQLLVSGPLAQTELERLMPVDLDELAQDEMCLTFLTNDRGGILDDLIVTRRGETSFFLVVNGACKKEDIEHISAHLQSSELTYFEKQSLLALQGPASCEALCSLLPDLADSIRSLKFMRGINLQLVADESEFDIYVSRSGYTGEDGFELSLPVECATAIARALLQQERVSWAGLGARDSLRLEAGLCLYGHDLDQSTTPIEAGFLWAIDKSRRADGSKPGGFLGDDVILGQIKEGVERRRRGFFVEGKVPVREGAHVVDENDRQIGVVTSGGVAPSLDRFIAMGYVSQAFLDSGEEKLFAIVRGKKQPLSIAKLPFVDAKYCR